MPIALNREDGGKLVCDAMIYAYVKRGLAEHIEMTSWQELEDEDQEIMRIAWDEIAAPYVKEITAIVEVRSHQYEIIRNLQARYEQLAEEYGQYTTHPTL